MSSRFAISRLLILMAAGPLLAQSPSWAEQAVGVDSAPPAASPAQAPSARPLESLRNELALAPHQQRHWQAYVGRLEAYAQLQSACPGRAHQGW